MAQQTSKLTAAAIVDAAIEVADRDGLDALSMRRIADELGVGAMSLYRHIADKDALLVAMAAEAGRRYPYPVLDTRKWTWRERVAVAVDIDWALYRRHPWLVLAYAAPRYSYGGDALEALDWLAAGFAELGVDAVRATEMALTLWSFINGVALGAVSEELLRAEPSGGAEGGLADLIAGRRSTDLPNLTALAGSSAAVRLTDPRAILDAGVATLCAGFETQAVG